MNTNKLKTFEEHWMQYLEENHIGKNKCFLPECC